MSNWLEHIRRGEGRAKRRTKAAILAETGLRLGRIDAAISAGTRHAPYVLADWVLGLAETVYGEGTMGRSVLLRNMRQSLQRLGYVPMANPRSQKGTWRLFGRDYTLYRKTSAPVLTRYAEIRKILRS